MPSTSGPSGAKCRHVVKGDRKELFMGMCQECFTNYVKSSGGILRGAEDPPAFKRNLVKCVLCVCSALCSYHTFCARAFYENHNLQPLCREIKVMRRQANEEAIKLLTNNQEPNMPTSVVGGIVTLGLTPPLENEQGLHAGLSTSNALICCPEHVVDETQAGTSRALVCLADVHVQDDGTSHDGHKGLTQGHLEEVLERSRRRPRTHVATAPNTAGQADEGNADDDDWRTSDAHESGSDDELTGKQDARRNKKHDGGEAKTVVKKKRGRPRKKQKTHNTSGMADPSLEAEFALVLLENPNVQQIVKTLEISNAELPAYNAQQAKDLLRSSKVKMMCSQSPEFCFFRLDTQ